MRLEPERVLATLRHRGPDGEGAVRDGGPPPVTFVHTRLAIQDLTEVAAQPMRSADGRWLLTYNGEIYNFHELAADLHARGCRLRSKSDTEVLLEGWALEGPRFIDRCRGMFAFALWDGRERELWLGRDRLGIKPLYYVANARTLAFASEVRTLVACGAAEPSLDREAIGSFLTFGAVRGPRTIVEGVRSLEPGTFLRWRPERTPVTTRYWRLSSEPVRPAPSRPEAIDAVRELLDETVRLRLVSDVPVAILLSSGIDSSVLAALAARHRREPIDAFTVRLDPEDRSLDEASEASLFARSIGLRHHDVVLRSEEILAGIDRGFAAMDQPTIDGLNTFFVTEAIHGHGAKVAISGLGGDEVFLGYPSARSLSRTMAVSRLLAPVRAAAVPVVRLAGSVLFRRLPLRLGKALDLPDLGPTPEEAVRFARTLFPAAGRASLGAAVRTRDDGTGTTATGDRLQRWSQAELTGYMANMLLRDTDAFSMAHPVEVRVPLIDHRLVEHVLGLPTSVRFVRGRQKALLVDAAGDLLQPGIGTRPKQGFVLPTSRWLAGRLRERMESLIRDAPRWERLGFDPRGVRAVWSSFLGHPAQPVASRPWALLALATYDEQLRRAAGGSAGEISPAPAC